MAHTGVALVMRGYSSALRRAGKRTFASQAFVEINRALDRFFFSAILACDLVLSPGTQLRRRNLHN
jgi:hypothetical protein